MIKALVIFLLVVGVANAAAPTATITCNRTSGVAPLAVICESGGADGDETRPFHTLLNSWSFGDSGAGSWSTGALAGLSKNGALGPVAGYVYESAGTYTIRVQVCDATACGTDTETITVTEISAANTVCVGIAAAPVAGSAGCPASANVAQKSDGDFDAMLATQLGASSACGASGCKRILLTSGETGWQYSANTTLSAAGPGLIGKHGTGADPVVTGTADVSALTFSANDWRIADLSFVGVSGATTAKAIGVTGTPAKISVIGASFSGFNYGVNFNGSEVAVIDSTFSNAAGTSAYGMFLNSTGHALVAGNSINIGVVASSHGFRSNGCIKCVISNNTANASGFSAMLVHAFDFSIAGQYSEKIVFSGNRLIGAATGSASGAVSFNPQSISSDERLRDVIVEGNLFIAGAVQNDAVTVEAVDVTIRNNIFVITGGNAKRGVNVTSATSTTTPMPSRVNVYNNTGYDADGSTDFAVVRYFTNLTGSCASTASNNLGYAPGSSNGVTVQNTGSCVVTSSTNSDNTQTRSTNPFLTTPNTSNLTTFQPSTAYADDGGTAAFPATHADFFNCGPTVAKKGTYPIGAMRKRSDAICAGAP